MNIELYTINTLTNLHVGSGDTNVDIVDNQVQKDPITKLPIIHSSSLKGAFREHFESLGNSGKLVNYIFGPDNSNDNNHQTGAYSFLEAQLLTRPVRSNTKPYFNATTPEILQTLIDTIERFGIAMDEKMLEALTALSKLTPQEGKPIIFENLSGTIVEELPTTYRDHDAIATLQTLLGKDLVLFCHKDFQALELPVIARNKLDNGKSVNLWYEEVVPKYATFFFAIGKPDRESIEPQDYEEKIKGFENRFNHEGSQLQIGANKSIGYGFCNITKVSL